MAESNKILLESGTNELEIVEFSVGESLYGINIAKVREIINADIGLVPVPDAHKSIDGAINLRGKIIPVINLARHLNTAVEFNKKTNRIIISEFNKIVVGFLVCSVARIHRLSWKQVEQPSDMLQSEDGYAVGIVKIEERVIFLLDFEKVAASINPAAGISKPGNDYMPTPSNIDRSTKTILVAEDSSFIRGMMLDYLARAGYKIIEAHNGIIAWEILNKAVGECSSGDIAEKINLVITDIEMPQMDGLHLIKRIREEKLLKKLPCVAFSSMITEELSRKCKAVGSNAEISKPEIEKLIQIVDEYVL